MKRMSRESSLDYEQLQLKKWCFDLRALIANFGTQFGAVARAKGLSLALKVSQDLPRYFLGDPLRVIDLLNNMANFSLKHLKAGGIFLYIKTSSQNRGRKIDLSLEDGIPEPVSESSISTISLPRFCEEVLM